MCSEPQLPLSSALDSPLHRLPMRDNGELPIVVRDNDAQELVFNVMPNRPVSETVRTCEYRVWYRYIEGEFDRRYFSSMLHSPDHLIFLSALIQLQRIVYVYMCHECRIPYEPLSPERLKIWPTSLNIEMPNMVTETKGLVHRLRMTTMKTVGERRFFAQSESDVNGVITIRAGAFIYLL